MIISLLCSIYYQATWSYMSNLLLNVFGGLLTGLVILFFVRIRDIQKINISSVLVEIEKMFSVYASYNPQFNSYRKAYWSLLDKKFEEISLSDYLIVVPDFLESLGTVIFQIAYSTNSNNEIKRLISKSDIDIEKCEIIVKNLQGYVYGVIKSEINVEDVKYICLAISDLIITIQTVRGILENRRYELKNEKIKIERTIL
jgi:hypothetical protein